MSNIVLFDVDTQCDFMDPLGALYVPGAEEIIGSLRKLFECAARKEVLTVSTLCSHDEGDPELKQFPPHCMMGTPGQARVLPDLPRLPRVRVPRGTIAPLTLASGTHYVVEKNTLDVFLNPWLARLSEVGAFKHRHCFVFGVATDYCVHTAVLGLLRAGARVSLVADAVRGLAREASDAAMDDMCSQGAKVCAVNDVIRNVDRGQAEGNCN